MTARFFPQYLVPAAVATALGVAGIFALTYPMGSSAQVTEPSSSFPSSRDHFLPGEDTEKETGRPGSSVPLGRPAPEEGGFRV